MGEVKTGGSLGGNEHALVEFTVLRDMGQESSQEMALNFRKVHFQLFRETVLRGGGKGQGR